MYKKVMTIFMCLMVLLLSGCEGNFSGLNSSNSNSPSRARLNEAARNEYIYSTFISKIGESSFMNVDGSLSQNDKEKIQKLNPLSTRFLQVLTAISGAEKVVELGTLIGNSAIAMARVLPKDGHVYTVEYGDEEVEWARANIRKHKLQDKISVLHGKALNILEEELDEEYDMVFIDADKGEYLKYLDWAEKHIKKGGLIIADNTLYFNYIPGSEKKLEGRMQYEYHVMNEFNARLADSEKYLSILYPYASGKDGMTIALKLY